jgi:IS30 family transposase
MIYRRVLMKITPQDKEDIRECYTEGASIAALAKSYEVTPQTIRNTVKDVEIKRFEDGLRYDDYRASFPAPKHSPKDVRNRTIRYRVDKGEKQAVVAADFGLSAAAVSVIVKV